MPFPISSPVPTPRNGSRYQVLAYLRVSHDLQKDNHTFETQEKRVREKLDQRYGVDRYDIKMYKDDGLSGGFGPTPTGIERRIRPSLKSMQQEISTGAFDCLAVYSTNRLFRSARWFFQYLEDVIIPNDIELISATENLDIATAENRTLMGLIAVVNASYRDSCAQRNRDAFAARAEDGFTLGPPPYGWEYEPRRESYEARRRGIIRNPVQAEYLLTMKDRYLAGINSLRIAGELNSKGITSPRGSRWDSGTVLKTLKNPLHAGLIRSKRDGQLYEGRHIEARYWDRATHEEILQICEKRRRNFKTNTGKADSPFTVNGIVSCARCGRRLYPSHGRKYRGYRCLNGRVQGQQTCPEVTIRAESLEDAVLNEMNRAACEPDIREILLSAVECSTNDEDANLEKERQALSKNLQGWKEQSDRLVDCLGRGVIIESRFQDADRVLQQQQREAKFRLGEIAAVLSNRERREAWAQKVQQAILDFPLCWKHATLDERRHLMLTLIEKLTIDRSGRDAIVTIKIHLLPERRIPVCFESTRHMKDRPVGVEGLTRRQLAFLHYVGMGKSHKEIADAMGTGLANSYTFAMQIRRYLGVHGMQDAYQMARRRIEEQMAFLPLGPSGRCKIRIEGPRRLTPCLLEVLPLLARGASYTEVARRTGLTPSAVSNRRKKILDLFQAKSMFEAGERARALGLLSDSEANAVLVSPSAPKNVSTSQLAP